MHGCLFMGDEGAKGLCLVFSPHVVLLTHKFVMWENLPHALAIARETQASLHPVSRVLSVCSQKSCKCFGVGSLESASFLDSPGHAGKQLDGLASPPNHVWTKPCATKVMGRRSENAKVWKWEAKLLGDGVQSGLDPIRITVSSWIRTTGSAPMVHSWLAKQHFGVGSAALPELLKENYMGYCVSPF